MTQSTCILGRQPELGLAELESLYGAELVRFITPSAAILALPAQEIDFARLGGSTKLATILAELPTTNWKLVEKELQKITRSTSFALPASGKFHLGLSAIGFDISPAKLNALGLTLKKVLRSRRSDGSVRLVPNTTPELSTAQVYHNHLADESGAELLIIAAGTQTLIARTVAVQDIDSYTKRDRARPKRDARVGMLPPKLAQIIINLASGRIPSADATPGDPAQSTSAHRRTLLDPFCGTGVVLQEAMLMGYQAYGSDLNPRMADYTQANLEWLAVEGLLPSNAPAATVTTADATTDAFTAPDAPPIDFVACETYLGRPFTESPTREILEQTVSEVNTIIRKFLVNIRPQLASGTQICLAVPAWRTGNRFRHLPVLDQLDSLGFSRVQLSLVDTSALIYHREDQIVGRELVTLRRK